MHAYLVFVVLIAGNAERSHVIGARVALGAGIRDVGRIHGRQRIAGRANAMNAVTTDARRDACFAFLFQQATVDTRVVLAFLVDAQAGVKTLNQVCVAVALAAVGGNIERLWLSEVPFPQIVSRLIRIGVWIATVAVVAHQAACFVNVVIEKFRGRAEARVVEFGMTFDAGVFLLGLGRHWSSGSEN